MSEEEIYLEIWHYLTDIFSCPVIQGLQNNSPMPKNCVVMTLLPYTKDLDQSQYYNENGESMIQVSRQYMMQLDFYGDEAPDRALKCASLWRSRYSTDKLKGVQPLYANDARNMEFINEQDQYEKRFLVEIALQYNPHYTYSEQSDILADLDIKLITTRED